MARRSRGGYRNMPPAVVAGAVTVVWPAGVRDPLVGAVTVIWPIVVVFLRCPAPCHVIAGKRRKRSNASCHQYRDGTDQENLPHAKISHTIRTSEEFSGIWAYSPTPRAVRRSRSPSTSRSTTTCPPWKRKTLSTSPSERPKSLRRRPVLASWRSARPPGSPKRARTSERSPKRR